MWSKCEVALLEAGIEGCWSPKKSLPKISRFPEPGVTLSQLDVWTTVSLKDCSQGFQIYNLHENFKCLTVLGDI